MLHYITLRYITLHYNCNCNSNYISLRYTTLYNYKYTTLLYTRLHYTIPHYSTQHYSTRHYTALITPHHNYNCDYTTLIILHYNYNSTTLHDSYNYNCARPHYIQQSWWGDHCNHCSHFKRHNSNHLSVHQWIRSAIRDSQQPTSPIGFLFLKLPPPPSAVLLFNYPLSVHICPLVEQIFRTWSLGSRTRAGWDSC